MKSDIVAILAKKMGERSKASAEKEQADKPSSLRYAEDLIQAIKDDDATGVDEALRSHYQECSGSSEDED